MQGSTSNLKRPRSASQIPSPDSTSSPKRAASEDPTQPSSDSIGVYDYSTRESGMAAESSPLRMDIGDTDSNKSWVEKTEQVRLDSDIGDGDGDGDTTVTTESVMDPSHRAQVADQQVWKSRYNDLLGMLPPPFNHYERYYILPKPILNKLQHYAYLDAEDLTSGLNEFAEAMEKLVPDQSAESFWVIQSERTLEGCKLIGKGKREDVWAMGDAEENVDFVFIPESGWDKVLSWFGPYEGPSLARYCVPPENIEIQPALVRVFVVLPDNIASSTKADEALQTVLLAPSTTPIGTFESFVVSVCDQKLDPRKFSGPWGTRIWKIETSPENDEKLLSSGAFEITPKTLISTKCELIDTSDAQANLAEVILGSSKSQIIAVEYGRIPSVISNTPMWNVDFDNEKQAIEQGSKPAPLFSKPAFFGGSESPKKAIEVNKVQTRSQGKSKNGNGLVGLQNLGNTCFMNSATQCLSNTPELSQYFLSGVYNDEINRDNPLGMYGQIAEAFGDTIENLWASAAAYHSSYSPRRLKTTTSRFAPQFAGYGQHDTQEFIAFLLDGLHEDLNRIVKKPYIEKPDWIPGGGDKELAELGMQCWSGYKKRNDSVIVDLFQGQLKSTLVCPECSKESITFDPFMYLTVPMPIAQHRHLKVTFVPRDTDKAPVPIRLLVPQNASFAQIKDRIGSMYGCKGSNIIGMDLWHNRPYAWWRDSDHNSEFKDSDDAVFYELDPSVTVVANRKTVGTTSNDGSFTVPVYTYVAAELHRTGHGRNDIPNECASKPFFVTLSRAQAADPIAVREAIMRGYTRFMRQEKKEEIYVHASSAQAKPFAPPKSEKSEDGEAVTETHLNGDLATVVEVPADQDSEEISVVDAEVPTTDEGSSMDVDLSHSNTAENITGNVSGLHPNGSTTSLVSHTSRASAALSQSGALVSRADLFKVYVADPSGELSFKGFKSTDKNDTVATIYASDLSKASSGWSLLEARSKSKKHIVNRLASGIVSIINTGHTSEDEEAGAAGVVADSSSKLSPKSARKEEKEQTKKLVVRPGEGIFCGWSGDTFKEWLEPEIQSVVVEDPAIEREVARKRDRKAITIEDCLDEFSKEETLGEDDLWYCPVCKKHQAATKRLEIYKVPDILVICIKRFGSARRMSDKLDNLVHFPVDGLDLEDRIGERKVAKTLALEGETAAEYGINHDGEPLLYDLYAVDNHFGGMGGGHYTAFCRNRVDGRWYNYDDSRVSPADESQVQSRAAYLLFYRRRTSRPIGGESRVKINEAIKKEPPAPESPPDAGPSMGTISSPSATPSPPEFVPSRLSLDVSDDELPSYSRANSTGPNTPAPPSPVLSDGGFGSSDEPTMTSSTLPYTRNLDLSAAGKSIGFGNTAWVSGARVPETSHTFGDKVSITPGWATDNDSESGVDVGAESGATSAGRLTPETLASDAKDEDDTTPDVGSALNGEDER